MKLFYMSFADKDRPQGQQWLGGLYIEAEDFPAAIDKAWQLGVNPGGEILSHEIPIEVSEKYAPRNKLLTLKELKAQAIAAVNDGKADNADLVNTAGEVIA